jgi:type II secretory pathway component PulM
MSIKARAKSFWSSRNDSERRTLAIAGATLLLTLSYLGLVQPLQGYVKRLRADVERNGAQLERIEAQIKTRQVAPPVASNGVSFGSLQAAVDQALRANNLQNGLKGLNTVDGTKVSVDVHGIQFDALAVALESLEREQKVQVLELSLEAKGGGFINARMVLTR